MQSPTAPGRPRRTIPIARISGQRSCLSIVAWVGALILAFVISQALVPDSSVPLSDKLTVSGFFDYLFGLDFVPSSTSSLLH